MTRRILHPSDFSTASQAAFKKAVELAKGSRAALTIVHVLSPVIPVPGDGYVSPKVYDGLAASSRAWANKQLAKRVARAKAAGVRAKGRLMEGIAHEQIVRAARRADLVVMGTHEDRNHRRDDYEGVRHVARTRRGARRLPRAGARPGAEG